MSSSTQVHAVGRRRQGRRLRDHGVVHPQRPLGRDADLAATPSERVRTAAAELQLPPQPQRPEPAHGHHRDHRRDLRPRRQRVRSPAGCSPVRTRPPGRCNHLLVIGETEGDPDVEAPLIEEMLDRQVDGILYATLATSEVTVPPRCCADQRLVLLNCLDVAGNAPAVVPDELEGGRTAAERADRRGPRAPGPRRRARTPTPGRSPGRCASQGVRERLAEVGVELGGVVPCAWDVVPAYDAVSAALLGRRADQRPGLPQRPDRDGRLPGAGRARPARARRRGGRLLRRLRARRLAPAVR